MINITLVQKLPEDYASLKEETEQQKKNKPLQRVLPNPNGNYQHDIDRTVQYSFYDMFYLSAGSFVEYETKNDNPYSSDPVMRLFYYTGDSDENHVVGNTWVNDDGGLGYQSKISLNITQSGYYCLYITSYSPCPGISDIYYNGSLYLEDMPFVKNTINMGFSSTEELNYFSTDGSSMLWIADQSYPSKIIGFSSEYQGSGYFPNCPRVKQSFTIPVGDAFISTIGPWCPTRVTDVYLKCKNGDATVLSWFPYLNSDDAIQSAPASGTYNCISWSGGIVDGWCWPPSDYNQPWYVSGQSDLTDFDNFYAYLRHIGADQYTRSGATSSNAVVDLWALNGYYTHGSVTKSGNNNPHGYDWESKPGGGSRTFHPRNALRGDDYGNINKHYIKISGLQKTVSSSSKLKSTGLTLKESVKKGLTKIKTVYLEKKETEKLLKHSVSLSKEVKNEFNKKFNAWKNTWNNPTIRIHSNPRKYAESKEYKELLKDCIKEGKKVLPLVIQKLDDGNYFVRNLLEDLTFGEYNLLMDEVRNERKQNLYNKEGKYIYVPSLSGWKSFAKKIISQTDFKGLFKNVKMDDHKKDYGNKIEDTSIKLTSYPNPFNPTTSITFNLEHNSKVSLKVFDITGREVISLINSEYKSKGMNNTNWNGLDKHGKAVKSGTYFIKLVANNKVNIHKMILMR